MKQTAASLCAEQLFANRKVDMIGIDDTSQGQCAAAANQRGGHIRCDLAVDHSGWAHSNREHELIWDGPPGELTPAFR